MPESIYSGSNKNTQEEHPTQPMASFANIMSPFVAHAPAKAPVARVAVVAPSLATASLTHALVALAAKLAVVDGTPNKAEYAAFHALFVEEAAPDALQRRSLFIKHVTDASAPLQYARQIKDATAGNAALHLDILTRLVQVANADAAINAAELECLRAVADVFGIEKETFRSLIGRTMAPAGASPYAVLGVDSHVTDAQLRAAYMAKVQMLHPDRYHAAGASAETVAMLSDQLAAVNGAYKAAASARAKKSSSTMAAASAWWGRKNTKGAEAR